MAHWKFNKTYNSINNKECNLEYYYHSSTDCGRFTWFDIDDKNNDNNVIYNNELYHTNEYGGVEHFDKLFELYEKYKNYKGHIIFEDYYDHPDETGIKSGDITKFDVEVQDNIFQIRYEYGLTITVNTLDKSNLIERMIECLNEYYSHF